MKVYYLKIDKLHDNKSRFLIDAFRSLHKHRMQNQTCRPNSISISSENGIIEHSTISIKPITILVHNFLSPISVNKTIYEALVKKQVTNPVCSENIDVEISIKASENIIAKYIVTLRKDKKCEIIDATRYEKNGKVGFIYTKDLIPYGPGILKHYANEDKTFFILDYCVSNISYYDFTNLTHDNLSFSIHDSLLIASNGTNVFPYLYEIRKYSLETYYSIIRAMNLLYPLFRDFVFYEQGENIEVRFLHAGVLGDLSIKMFPQHLLKCLAVFTLLTSPIEWLPGIILIDNIESGIHSYAMHNLAHMIDTLSHHKTIIACTSSPELIQKVPIDSVVMIRNKDNKIYLKQMEKTKVVAHSLAPFMI